MDVKTARKHVVAALEEKGFLEKTTPHKHNVGHCYRCQTRIEPRVSEQWFVEMKPLADPALEAVRTGQVQFIPEHFSKTYFNWMENIRDWNISRQLWWGDVYKRQDLMRTFERAVHRARLPVVWSQGFNPRPAIEFALPVGVGIETRKDPFSLVLSEAIASNEIGTRLNEVLPVGLRIVEVEDYEQTKKSLMARVEAATYEFVGDGVQKLLEPLSTGGPLVVEKHSKKGRRDIDIRPGIRSFELADACLLYTSRCV